MQELQANTQVKVVIGPAVAVGDGFTPVTNLALGTADEAELMKHDAASVVDISGNTFAAIANADGYYNLTLTTTDTNTEGMLTILINDDSLCLPIIARFMVLAQAAYISKYTAKDSGYMDVDIKAVGGTATPHTSGKLHVLQGDGNAITAVGPTKAEMDTAHALLTTPAQVATALTNYDAPTKTEMDTGHGLLATEAKQDIIDTVVDGIQTDLDNATDGLGALKALIDALEAYVLGMHDLSAAEVNTEVDTALADINLDHFIQIASTVNDGAPNQQDFDTNLTETTNNHYNDMVIVFTSGALAGQARRIADYTGASKNIQVVPNFTEAPANGDAFIIVSGAYLQTYPETVMNTIMGPDSDDLAQISSEIDAVPTVSEIQAEMEENGASILDTLRDELADGGRLDLLIDAILTDTNELQGLISASKIAAQVKGIDDIDLSATMKTSVNAEVVDALGTDTIAELSQGIPATTPTIKTALMLIYMTLRNQFTTKSDELGVFNDAGTKIAKKGLSDDGTTYTEGKMASGA